MRTFLLILLVALIGVGAYGYTRNPVACKKLAHDLKADLTAIYGKPAAELSNMVVALWNGTNSAPAMPTAPGAPKTPATNAPPTAAVPAAPAARTTPVPPAVPVTPAAPAAALTPPAVPAPSAPSVVPAPPAAPAGWHRPAVIPSEPDWTWTTPDKIYRNVKIVRIEADQVTISHAEGTAVISTWSLPDDIRKELNYDPAAATAAKSERQKGILASEPVAMQPQVLAQNLAPQAPARVSETTDYAAALAQAKLTKQLILLHFTGSDWCYYCKMLEQEVMSTPDFTRFAASNYILVTLDFPHSTPISDSLKQQNASLAQKFHVNGFPTLLVIDSTEKELGRTSGYSPGSGPSAVISQLKAFSH